MKVKTEVCELCRKESCSGNNYWVYNENTNKIKWVCEHETELFIHGDVFSLAINLYEKDNDSSTHYTTKKYILMAARKLNLPVIPVVRRYFFGCGDFGIAMPKQWQHENYNIHYGSEYLFIRFKQVMDCGAIHNTGWAKLEDVLRIEENC